MIEAESEPEQPEQLSPTEEFLRDTGHAWTRREDGMIVVTGLNLGEDNMKKCGKWPLTVLPDLASVIVEGEFRCSDNELTSLKGCPQTVTGNFYCHSNKLTSLKHAPAKVGGDFSCSFNLLPDLMDGPKEVGGRYNCQSCPRLLTLKGAPEVVPGDFLCHEGVLESLEGGPVKVGGDMWVFKNRLRNIEHAPREVGRYFQCHFNYGVTHLEGAPEKFVKIYSDLGDFEKLSDIPDEIRWSPETRAKREEERLRAAAEQLERDAVGATILDQPMAIRKKPLRLKM
jgi:hypothetical protein